MTFPSPWPIQVKSPWVISFISGLDDSHIQARPNFGGFFTGAEGLVGKQIEKQVDKEFQDLKQLMEKVG
jgi:hypothetical protein